MRHLYFTLGLILFSTTAFGQFKVIKDISSPTVANEGSISDTAPEAVVFKDRIYFIAEQDNVYGEEIFVTDGTSAGTKIFIDLKPGPDFSGVQALTPAGDKLFFVSSIGATTGRRLYVSDGTVAGTKLVSGNVQTSLVPKFGAVGSTVYFDASQVYNQGALWKSDGTEAGTVFVKQITGTIGDFYSADDLVYFTVYGNSTLEIWVSDGTANGTKKVVSGMSVNDDPNSPTFAMATLNNTLYFTAKDNAHHSELWKVNSSSSPAIVKGEIDNGVLSPIRVWNHKIFFTREISEDEYGYGQYKLFMTDGTAAGTIALIDAEPFMNFSSELNGKLYFSNGTSLTVTDGTPGGTQVILPQSGTIRSIRGIGSTSNKIFLVVEKQSYEEGKEHDLWSYDEINGLIKTSSEFTWNIYHWTEDNILRSVSDKLFIDIEDPTYGIEPFAIDGTGAVTLLKDINKAFYLSSETPNSLIRMGNNVFFKFNDGVHGQELWKTDGTEEGTVMVKDIFPGANWSIDIYDLVVLNNLVYFTAYDASNNLNVWRSDGTEAGTFKVDNVVHDSNSQPSAPSPNSPVINGITYYFQRSGQLWKTDGSEGSAQFVKTTGNGLPTNFAVVGNNFFFIDAQHNLWKSDGTADGTVIVFNTVAAFPGDGQYIGNYGFYQAEGKWFLLGHSGTNFTLWKSDGTQSGTSLIKTLSNMYVIPVLGVIGDKVYYVDASTANGQGLWASDGTSAGTVMIKNLDPNATSSQSVPIGIYSDATTIYMGSIVGEQPTLWKTDGTANGTVVVKEPGPAGYYNPYDPNAKGKIVNGVMYFVNTESATGSEPWKTDGTSSGTKLVGELIPGPASSVLHLETTGDHLIMVAQDADHGYRLWTLDPNFVLKDQQIDFETIGTKNSKDAPFTLTATASSGLPVTFEIVSGPATISGNTLTLTGGGEVTVQASQDGNGEYNSISVEQSFTVNLVLGLEGSADFTVWPNPATNTLTFNSQSISLTDMLGHAVITKESGQGETTIDVSHLSRGMYLANLKGADEKIIITKIVLR